MNLFKQAVKFMLIGGDHSPIFRKTAKFSEKSEMRGPQKYRENYVYCRKKLMFYTYFGDSH